MTAGAVQDAIVRQGLDLGHMLSVRLNFGVSTLGCSSKVVDESSGAIKESTTELRIAHR
jgi:hypothetical protein